MKEVEIENDRFVSSHGVVRTGSLSLRLQKGVHGQVTRVRGIFNHRREMKDRVNYSLHSTTLQMDVLC